MFEIVASKPIAVGIRGIHNGFEFFFGEIVGGLHFGFYPLHENHWVLVNPIHSSTEPEKGDQPLMLAALSLWSVAPLTAKLGQLGCGQLIEVNKPLPLCPSLELRFKEESAFAIAVFAQMPRLFIITKTLDRIGNRALCARFWFVRIGCIFEIAL